MRRTKAVVEALATAAKKGIIKAGSTLGLAVNEATGCPSLLPMTEAEFQELVVAEAQIHGWLVAHFGKVPVKRGKNTYWETPARADGAGYPDLHMVGIRGSIFVELKVGKNKPTLAQQQWHDALRAAGCQVYVWYPKDWPEIRRVLTGG